MLQQFCHIKFWKYLFLVDFLYKKNEYCLLRTIFKSIEAYFLENCAILRKISLEIIFI